MKRKSLVALFGISMILLSLMTPIAFIQTVQAADPASWYQTVSGVLGTDYYALYPFNQSSLKVGFSKFGEIIDGSTKVGLEYKGFDPFADDPYVPEGNWMEGWLLNITYAESGHYRNVWAYALYSDGLGNIGGDWNNHTADPSLGGSGRRAGGTLIDGIPIGWAWTRPIKVLYHSSRKFVAILNTTVGVTQGDKDYPIVNLLITLIFNKVEKNVIQLKDIKLVDTRKTISALQVEFSERGEWDMGKVFRPATHAYFYNNQSTCYHTRPWHPFYNDIEPDDYSHAAWYDVCQLMSVDPAGYVGYAAFWPKLISKWIEGTSTFTGMLRSLETYLGKFSGTGARRTFEIGPNGDPPYPSPIEYPRGQGVWSDEPMVWVNDQMKRNGTDYTWFPNNDTIVFYKNKIPPAGTNNIWVVYKTEQIQKNVPGDEPCFVIGEWDFDLSYKNMSESTHQFRAVTVYGLTDQHDADDENIGSGHQNVLDREVVYQLDEIFTPWDLNNAVHKTTARWVQFETGDGECTDFYFEHNNLWTGEPVVDDTSWDKYCASSESILVDGVLQARGEPTYEDSNHGIYEDLTYLQEEGHPDPRCVRADATYDLLYYDSDCVGIRFYEAPEEDAVIKILYSTYGCYHWDHWSNDPLSILIPDYGEGPTSNGRYEWITIGRDSAAVDSGGAAMVAEYFDSWKDIEVWNSGLDMKDDKFGPFIPSVLRDMRNQAKVEGRIPRTSFRDANIALNKGRLALQDDWCEHVPVASSNIIVVGGPSANLVAEYFNDFTDAFATLPVWTPNAADVNKIIPLSCWSMNRKDSLPDPWNITHAYVPEYDPETDLQTVGYAVISTCKDKNGTVGFIVWGYTGQDTYFACWALWNTWLGLKLQLEPDCLTSIILRFDYSEECPYPCFWEVVEALGTISEYHFHLKNYPYFNGSLMELPCDFFEKQPPLHPDP